MKKIKSLATIILMITVIILLKGKAEATTGKVNSETIRLRKEASTKSTILEQLDKGEEVEILEEVEGWYKVKATIDGKNITGYVSKDLLDVESNNIPNNTTTNNEEKPETNVEEQPNNKPSENKEQQPENNNENTGEVIDTTGATTNIEEEKEYTINQTISIKTLPLMSAKESSKIDNGKVKIVEIINDWCRIENETEIGWIRTNILKKAVTLNQNTVETQVPETNIEPEKNPQVNEKENQTDVAENNNQETIKIGYVNADGLRVRKKASTDSEEIDSLKKNDKVTIIEEVDGWYKIKFGDTTGYVFSKYISDKKVPETTSRGEETSRSEEKVTPIEKEETEENNTTSTINGEAVVEFAKQYLGYKYVSGGSTPEKGFDCSGFTQYVYKHFGVTLSRSSQGQSKNGKAVDRANLQKGDLLIFNGESNKTIGHVGIYIGGGQFIHASNPTDGVKITALGSSYYNSRYVGARRVIN